jgi:hypothetical protein
MVEIAFYGVDNLKWENPSKMKVVVNINLIKIKWWYVPQ